MNGWSQIYGILAAVVNGSICIEGLCPGDALVRFVGLAPSKDSLVGALREAGME